jgi:hypothetical protein
LQAKELGKPIFLPQQYCRRDTEKTDDAEDCETWHGVMEARAATSAAERMRL